MTDQHTQWHDEVLPEGWARAAADLDTRGALDGFYLAGGTGLALHAGHRRSVDLDLFSEHEFSAASQRARCVNLTDLRIRQVVRGTLHIELHQILVSFLYYPYPLLFPLRRFRGLSVADPRDIACMKVDAIASRGTRRDFVDLYVTATSYGLREVLDWFERKYAAAPYNRTHILKSLTYFGDAELEPMPNMLAPLDWATVTQFFRSQVPRLTSFRP